VPAARDAPARSSNAAGGQLRRCGGLTRASALRRKSCATCHSGPEFTDANTRLHLPSDSMGEPEPAGVTSYASRSATKQYRTAPLEGVWQHAPYFHNGSAATLDDVVSRYNTRRSLGLTAAEMADLVQ
jgi:cytochrome c peroxidase